MLCKYVNQNVYVVKWETKYKINVIYQRKYSTTTHHLRKINNNYKIHKLSL